MHAARFTTKYVRLVGQEPAPSKCVLLRTSREVRKDMKGWVLSQKGDQWSVKFGEEDGKRKRWADCVDEDVKERQEGQDAEKEERRAGGKRGRGERRRGDPERGDDR